MSGKQRTDKNDVTLNEFSIESIDDISSSSINFSTVTHKGRGGSANNISSSSRPIQNKDTNPELVIDLTGDSTGNFDDSDEDDLNLMNRKTRRVRRNIFDSEDGDYSQKVQKSGNSDKKRRNSSQPPQLKRANSSGLGTIDVRDIVKSISANSSPKKQKTKANSLDFLSSFTVNNSKILRSSLNSNTSENRINKNHPYENSYESIPWTTKYSPQRSSEVFLHPSKIKDVRSKLSDMINRRCKSRVLVLSGPSGSGKSTLARLLANELIQEKLSNNSYEYGSRSSNKTKMSTLEIGDVEVKEEGDTSTKSENIIEYKLFSTSTSKLTSPVTNFREFLDQCKFLKNKCVLIEELPNLYHPDTLRNFQESISEWLELSKVLDDLPVLIICITDVEIDGYDSFTGSGNGLSSSFGIERNFITETIMGPKLMEMENVDYTKGGWSHIKFNPVAKMYMKRILNTIIKNESSIIKRIPAAIFNFKFNKVFIKNGDIRNSINNLEYWCKFFYNSKYDSEYYIEIENFGDGSSINGNNNINAIGKEVNLDLFHSIGKILYGTQHVEEEIESFLKSNNNHSLVSEEEGNNHDYVKSINFIISSNVTRDIISQFNIFNLNIIENYCNLNSMQFPIDSNLTDLIDNVSLSDVLSSIGDSINSTNLGISNNNNNFNNKLRNSNFRTTTNLISEESALISVFGSRLNLDNISKKIEILINENKINKNKNLNLKYSRDSKIKRKNNSLYSEIKNYKLNRLNNLLLSKSSNHYSYLSDTDCMLYDGFYESNILNSRKFRMRFNSRISKNNNKNNNTYNIPRVERLGGGFENLVLADNKLKLIDEDTEESDGSKLEVPALTLNGIKKTINNNHRKISPNDLQKYEDFYFLGFADEIAGGITGDHDFDGDKSDSSEFDLDPIVNSDDDEAPSEEKFQSGDDFSDSDEELLDL